MSKSFRLYKKFRKSHGKRGKLTFGDYKKILHLKQKIEKMERKYHLKAKSMLSQGRKSVVIGKCLYRWGKDKKSIVVLEPDFDLTRRVFEIIKKDEEENNGKD